MSILWDAPARGPLYLIAYWGAISTVGILLASLSPLLALAVAAVGGTVLGWQGARMFERAHTPPPPIASTSHRLDVWHWIVIGLILTNYAWFVLQDRPYLPGVILLLAAIGIRWWWTRSLLLTTPLDPYIAIIVLLMLVFGTVTTVNPTLSRPKLYGVAFSVLLFYEIVRGLQSERQWSRWLLALSLLGVTAAIVGFVETRWFVNKLIDLRGIRAQLPTGLFTIPRSLRGGLHPNGVAATLIYLIPLYAVMLLSPDLPPRRYRRLSRGLAGLALASTVPVLLLTQSRGALAALAVALVALFFALRQRYRLSLLTVVGAMAIAFLILQLLPAGNPEVAATGRPRATTGHSFSTSYQFRQQTWRLGLQVVQAYPLRTPGLATLDHVGRYVFPELYSRAALELPPRFRDTNTITHAHNELLQVAIDIGIPGFVAYVALWAALVWIFCRTNERASHRSTRRIVLGIAAGLLAHQLFGLTDAFLLGTKPGIVMWLLMAIVTGLYLNLRRPLSSPSSTRLGSTSFIRAEVPRE